MAEDLHAAGLALLHTALGALAEPASDAGAGPGPGPGLDAAQPAAEALPGLLSARDVARLVEGPFTGDGAGGFPRLAAFLAADPALARLDPANK